MRFFFYGTLIDPDVRRAVLGARAAGAIDVREASLEGWERRAVRGETYPVILRRAGGRVDGLLASGLGAPQRRRLVAYEGDGYDLLPVSVSLADGRARMALVFAPTPGGALKPASSGWDYARWLSLDKRGFLRQFD